MRTGGLSARTRHPFCGLLAVRSWDGRGVAALVEGAVAREHWKARLCSNSCFHGEHAVVGDALGRYDDRWYPGWVGSGRGNAAP